MKQPSHPQSLAQSLAWFGNPAVQQQALDRIKNAMANGMLGHGGWRMSENEAGCAMELICESVDGEETAIAAARCYNVPAAFTDAVARSYDTMAEKEKTQEGRGAFCHRLFSAIPPHATRDTLHRIGLKVMNTEGATDIIAELEQAFLPTSKPEESAIARELEPA